MHTARRFTTIALICLSGSAFAQVGTNKSVLNPNLAETAMLTKTAALPDAAVSKLVGARPLSSNEQIDELMKDLLSDEARSALRRQLFLPVNLNTATEQELHMIPGINRRMVHEFEEYRPYTSLEQFRREIGKYVNESEVARFEQFVFIPLDLNSASAEDLATIPGMNRKMVHEFEEYRPYQSVDQFRREIGKYVDDNEVTRLERYIYIQ